MCFMPQGSFGSLTRDQTVRGTKYLTFPEQWFHTGHLRDSPLKMLLQNPSTHLQPCHWSHRTQNRPRRLQGFISTAEQFIVFQQEIKKQTGGLTCSRRRDHKVSSTQTLPGGIQELLFEMETTEWEKKETPG